MIKFALATVFLLLLGRSILEPTQLALTKVSIPEGPPVKIAIYSDLHLAKGRAPLAKLKEALVRCRPDLIFALGDFSEELLSREQLGYMQSLFAIAPTYGVLGNNDLNPELLRQLKEAGITILQNEGVELETESGPLFLYGVEDQRAGSPNLSGLDRAEGAFIILLSHSPEIATELQGRRVDLILAGHTHGGQLCLPGGHALLTHSRLGPKYASGKFSWGEATLFITRGVGTSALPLRLFCLPELVILELGFLQH
jgi:predicted MPP superfamily phosphohydrolase